MNPAIMSWNKFTCVNCFFFFKNQMYNCVKVKECQSCEFKVSAQHLYINRNIQQVSSGNRAETGMYFSAVLTLSAVVLTPSQMVILMLSSP